VGLVTCLIAWGAVLLLAPFMPEMTAVATTPAPH